MRPRFRKVRSRTRRRSRSDHSGKASLKLNRPTRAQARPEVVAAKGQNLAEAACEPRGRIPRRRKTPAAATYSMRSRKLGARLTRSGADRTGEEAFNRAGHRSVKYDWDHHRLAHSLLRAFCVGNPSIPRPLARAVIPNSLSVILRRLSLVGAQLRIEEPVLATEVIDIRRFDPGDFVPLFQAEAQAWTRPVALGPRARRPRDLELPGGQASRRLRPGQRRTHRRLQLFLCEGEKGLVGDFFLAPAFRAPCRSLLNHVLRRSSPRRASAAWKPNCPISARKKLEPCFHEYGFTSYMRRFMSTWKTRRSHRQPRGSGAFVIEPWERRHDHLAADSSTARIGDTSMPSSMTSTPASEGADRLIDNIFDLRGCGEPVPQHHWSPSSRQRKAGGPVALTTVRRQYGAHSSGGGGLGISVWRSRDRTAGSGFSRSRKPRSPGSLTNRHRP